MPVCVVGQGNSDLALACTVGASGSPACACLSFTNDRQMLELWSLHPWHVIVCYIPPTITLGIIGV